MNMPPLPVEPRGRVRLWVVFWIYGVVLSHVLFGAILYFYRQASTPALVMMFGGFLLYTAWIMHTIWVDALNVKNENWGYLARWLTVAWAINAVLVSVFLFLGHLGKVTLPF
ncbi:MAG: hypothetical protein KDF54_16875 [Hydrogenophaga sp.]|nr:hypothetical protein [Hydrogenophaga sp.]